MMQTNNADCTDKQSAKLITIGEEKKLCVCGCFFQEETEMIEKKKEGKKEVKKSLLY